MAYEDELSAGGYKTVTAFFDSRDDASEAVENLVEAGIPRDRITMIAGSEGSQSPRAASDTRREPMGFWESLADLFMPEEDRNTYAEGLRRGGYLVTVRTTATEYDTAVDILDDEGSIDMDERATSWRSEGWTGYQSGARVSDAPQGRSVGVGSQNLSTSTGTGQQMGEIARDRLGSDDAIPIAREQIKIGKRDVSHGRVRVRSYVVEEPVSEDVELREERVEVERRPVDRAAQPQDRLFEERTVEMEQRAEEPIVSKEARVTEEVALRKQSDRRTETVSDTVKHTEVNIEDDRDQDRSKPRP